MGRGRAFKIGRIIKNNGYAYVWEPTHPLAHREGYVAEHRKVVYDAGIEVPPGHHVHHKNHDKLDNRLENLEVVNAAEHRRTHGFSANAYGTFPVAQTKDEQRARWREHNATQQARRRAKNPPVPCPTCGELFKPDRAQKFCSRSCGARFNRNAVGRRNPT